MNCKPGDLAVIVRSRAGNEGRIVRCIEFIGKKHALCGDDRWRIDVEIRTTWGRKSRTARDSDLRPIRDSDGQDESLTWAPKKVTA